jgi:hypothetical protein
LNYTIREPYSLLDFLERFILHTSLDSRLIHSLEAKTRMHQPLRYLTVIGQNHKTRRVPVETPNRKIGLIVLGQKISDCSSTFRIAQSRDHAAWLVKQHDSFRSHVDRATINLDSIYIRIDLSAQLGAHLAVYLNPPLDDKTLHLSTRSDTALREKLL